RPCARGHPLHAVRLRRAAVLLARLRPAGGLLLALDLRQLPAVPHLRGQPGAGAPGMPGAVSATVAASRKHRGARSKAGAPEPEMRTATGPAWALFAHRRAQRGTTLATGAVVGFEHVGRS